MAEKKYLTIQQHQPLRVPSGWNHEERSFVMQLEEILDDIYKRFGKRSITSDTIIARVINADEINCPDSIPNIVHGADEPEPGNNTIWLEPDTVSGTGEDYTDTRTVKKAEASSCPERKRPTFTYTCALNSPIDFSDVTSLTLTGKVNRQGNDFGQYFTVTGKLKFSDGTTKSLGQMFYGRTRGLHNISASLSINTPIKKTLTAVVYTVSVQDNYGYLCSFYAGTLSVAGTHPATEPTDVVTVHYIP